jgi:hypothetical protein
LGRRRSVSLARVAKSLDLALLRVDSTPEAPLVVPFAARDPFPGSPAYAVAYLTAADSLPAWPLLRSGFFGAPRGDAGVLALSVDGAGSGPIFDGGGRLAGFGVRGPGNAVVPISVLRREFGEVLGADGGGPTAPRAPADQIYEMAMPITVQVILDGDSDRRP